MGWIGVDFDGTLAQGHNIHKPGPPIRQMLERVKGWLAEGKDVRIFTARVGPATDEECLAALCEIPGWKQVHPDPLVEWVAYQIHLLEAWCREHLGQTLPITATKDLHTVEIWDDLARQVITNTGRTMEEERDHWKGLALKFGAETV